MEVNQVQSTLAQSNVVDTSSTKVMAVEQNSFSLN